MRFVLSVQHWEERIQLDQYCIEELRFWRINLDYFEVRDSVSTFIRLNVSFIPMRVLLGVVQLSPLMRIIYVYIDFGNHLNAQKVLYLERTYRH